jgi:hypothetical protein
MVNRATAFVTVGILGQVDGHHLPPSISGMLIAGGMTMIAMDYIRRTSRSEKIADLERDLGLNPLDR